jgi:phage terminase large subunit GpA-like protein
MKASAQVGKTLILTLLVGYFIDQDPANILWVMPTLDAAEAYSKEKLTPFLRETPCLAAKTLDPRSRDSGNTLLTKQFIGGAHLAIAGANSPTSLASRHRRILICDEVDKYEASAGTEGDPINLAKKRTRTYWNRKHFYASTPNLASTSRVDDLYEGSDQRKFFVPCLHCNESQVLKWQNVHYIEGEKRIDKNGQARRVATKAWIQCEHCAKPWTEAKRLRAIQNGTWVATAPFHGRAGFHIWAAYSPYVDLTELASEWLEAQGKPEQLKDFVNGTLGETYREKGEAPEWKRIFDRRENYRLGSVPVGAHLLTAGVDVQSDRLEVAVIGWGRNRRAWLVDYQVIEGDTARVEVWSKLDSVLGTVYEGPGGERTIRKLAIDSGFGAQYVYDWARRHRFGPVAVVKGGSDGTAAPVSAPSAVELTVGGQRLNVGLKVHIVNTGYFKSELYGRLRLELPNVEKGEDYPDGFFHICVTDDTEEYCKQLTAEHIVTRTHRGYTKREWEKIRPRNEALDTWVYARAAVEMLGYSRWTESNWAAMEGRPVQQNVVRAAVGPVVPVIRKVDPSAFRPIVAEDPYL